MAVFIANALSPAKVMNVLLDDSPDSGKTATVIVPDRQLSLAIGKEGQNARLAAKLTGWRIDIKSATEAAEETLGRLEDVKIPPEDMDLLALAEAILRKRETGVFSEEEIAIIEADVTHSGEEEMPWPQAGPAAEMAPEPLTAQVDEEEVLEQFGEPEFDREAMTERVPDLLADEEATASTRAFGDESELEPPFEGEPIEDSIGWVRTEPELDFYTDWDDELVPEEEEKFEEEWIREDFEEPEDIGKDTSKKKKKKKAQRGRTRSSSPFDKWE
jgi:N utilization substance protein A